MSAGNDAPLTEEGYQVAAATKSTPEMEIFIRRAIADMGCRLDDAGSLGGFAMWYSGEKAVQSFARLRQELLEMKWVSVAVLTGDNVPITEDGYQQLAAKKDTKEMVKLCRRILAETGASCSDDDTLAGFAGHFSGEWGVQSLAKMREELGQAAWVKRTAAPTDSWWKPDATCDGSRAEDRAKWLMDNQGLSQDAAREKVRSEFPAVFGEGVLGASSKFGEKFARVPYPGGAKSKLRMEIRPKDAAGISLIAVHYSINGSPELNFDIKHHDGGANAWVHETPSGDGYPDVPPGATVRYWLYLIRNGVGEQEPADATGAAAHRLEVTL